jgi:N-methylhydantoinase A
MSRHVGVDIGGTFTDVAAVDLDSGESHFRKLPSTPANPADGAAAGLAALSAEVPLADVSFFAHGTTAGTNALIEGKGARTALITTEGFRDLLEIARQRRPALYDLLARKPRPLVPRRWRREAAERLRSDGSAVRALDAESLERELNFLKQEGIESLAICLLHSYANSSHEREIRALAEDLLPGIYVTASSDLLPRFREYERLSTTVVNAYLGPLMSRYLIALGERTAAAGVRVPPHVIQSNGGLYPLAEASRVPAATILSGPAAGATSAASLCARLGIERAISMDMGGTSTDVCLIDGGLPAAASGREVAGYAVELPGVDVRCIGAGGGSIIAVDPGRLLQVGPRSAGAEPGPVCYGRGGAEPTLTDALLVLGRLAQAGLLGGEMPLDATSALKVVGERVAEPLGLTTEQAAGGAVEVAVANICRAVESLTVAQGHDPREFRLIAAGGAGPLIACEVAKTLAIEEVIVPDHPGSFSANGLLVSDIRRDWVRTQFMRADGTALSVLTEGLRQLEQAARDWLAENALADHPFVTLRSVSARYEGQDYELDVAVPSGKIDRRALATITAAFHSAHEQRYGYRLSGQNVEFVDLRVAAIADVPAPRRAASVGGRRVPEPTNMRTVYLKQRGAQVQCPVYERGELVAGCSVDGPAIIEQYDSTTYIPPGSTARVEADGDLRITSR